MPIDIFKVTAISIFKTLSGSHHHVSKNILFGDTQSESIPALSEVMGRGIICALVNFSLAFEGRKIRRTTSDSTALRAALRRGRLPWWPQQGPGPPNSGRSCENLL